MKADVNDGYLLFLQSAAAKYTELTRLQFALSGFMNKLASHLERSPLVHSYGYESAGDRPTCFTSLPIKSKSFMQYAG